MLSPNDLLLYLGALMAVYLLPGPDMAMILATTLKGGCHPGMLVALGLAISRAIHVCLSGLGLAALLMAHPALFDALRILGAFYLLWLAGQVMLARGLFAPPVAAQPLRAGHALRQGLLTNLMNPKAFLFCALFLPQFMPASPTGPAGQYGQYLLPGSILVLTGGVFDIVYVLAAGRLRQSLQAQAAMPPLAGACFRAGFAGVFLLAALRLLWR